MVELTVNSADRADVGIGEEVVLTATVEVLTGAGRVVAAEWSVEGTGRYVAADIGPPSERLRVTTTASFAQRGTYSRSFGWWPTATETKRLLTEGSRISAERGSSVSASQIDTGSDVSS